MTRLPDGRKPWMLLAAILFLTLFLGALHVGLTDGALAQPAYPGPCDVNGNGQETIQDALLIAQHVVGLTDLSPTFPGPADCDGNGSVTISDALLVAQKVVGLA